jgi:ADP-dependent NAD(P)H-hydrate dehydratase / NAD(P)H-hydrate epimerase
MKLVTLEQMRTIEQEAVKSGTSVEKLMDRAGKGIAEFIQFAFSDGEEVIAALVGSGNNGGDALVALTELAGNGWKTHAILARPRAENDLLVKRLQEKGGDIHIYDPKQTGHLFEILADCDLLLDGVLGAGIKLPLKVETAEFLAAIKPLSEMMPVIAVDCPSGVDMETGEAAPETIPADITLCMGAVKEGLLRLPAFSLAGDLEVVDLKFSNRQQTWNSLQTEVVDAEMVSGMLPRRDPQAHKGTFGTAMIVAGSINFTGAALLAARAAYQVGTGLVRLAIPGPLYQAIAGQLPEVTWLMLPHEQGVIHSGAAGVVRDNLEKITALLLGPGWGHEETTGEFLRELVLTKVDSGRKGKIGFLEADGTGTGAPAVLPPLVFDADGLNLLSKAKGWEKDLPAGCILTPHPGEMSTLTGLSVDAIQSNRSETVRKFAKAWNQVIVLKGAQTLIADPMGRIFIIPVATSALAKAGSGDVLSGMITGLRAQGLGATEAALCGAWLHAQAGLAAVEVAGDEAAVMATDVINCIGEVLADIR